MANKRGSHSAESTMEELLSLQAQLRRGVEHSKTMKNSNQKALRELATVKKQIAKLRASNPKGNLFDTQIDLDF